MRYLRHESAWNFEAELNMKVLGVAFLGAVFQKSRKTIGFEHAALGASKSRNKMVSKNQIFPNSSDLFI